MPVRHEPHRFLIGKDDTASDGWPGSAKYNFDSLCLASPKRHSRKAFVGTSSPNVSVGDQKVGRFYALAIHSWGQIID
jgi:hypothetical protein